MKRRPQKRDSEEEAPKQVLPPMPAGDLKEMVGYLKYNGLQKASPDDNCKAALEKFHNASPEEKRKMLASFKSPSGKSLKWAKEIVVRGEGG